MMPRVFCCAAYGGSLTGLMVCAIHACVNFFVCIVKIYKNALEM